MTEADDKKKQTIDKIAEVIPKTVRFPSDVVEAIAKFTEEKKQAGETNYSENRFVLDAVAHYLKCRTISKESGKSSETMRRIQNKYDGKFCSNSHPEYPDKKKPIPKSASCWWAPGSPDLLCQKCHDEAELAGLSDPVLSKKFRLNRTLDQTKRALTNDCNQLADKYEHYQARERLDALDIATVKDHNHIAEFDAALQALKSNPQTSEEKKLQSEKFETALQNAAALDKELLDEIGRDREFFDTAMKKKKKAIMIPTEDASE